MYNCFGVDAYLIEVKVICRSIDFYISSCRRWPSYWDMGGLRSFVNWRTFLVGLMCGYVMAWCIHRVVMFKTADGRWVEERVPYLTPSWAHPDK